MERERERERGRERKFTFMCRHTDTDTRTHAHTHSECIIAGNGWHGVSVVQGGQVCVCGRERERKEIER
jgi:hypothetical protein